MIRQLNNYLIVDCGFELTETHIYRLRHDTDITNMSVEQLKTKNPKLIDNLSDDYKYINDIDEIYFEAFGFGLNEIPVDDFEQISDDKYCDTLLTSLVRMFVVVEDTQIIEKIKDVTNTDIDIEHYEASGIISSITINEIEIYNRTIEI